MVRTGSYSGCPRTIDIEVYERLPCPLAASRANIGSRAQRLRQQNQSELPRSRRLPRGGPPDAIACYRFLDVSSFPLG